MHHLVGLHARNLTGLSIFFEMCFVRSAEGQNSMQVSYYNSTSFLVYGYSFNLYKTRPSSKIGLAIHPFSHFFRLCREFFNRIVHWYGY